MTELQSNLTLKKTSSSQTNDPISGYKLGLSNIIYQVTIAKDGNQWCALIGQSLQDGISGFGDTTATALHELANKIDQK